MRFLIFTLLLSGMAGAVQGQHVVEQAAPAPADSLAGRDTVPNAVPAFTTVQPALSRVAGVQVTPYSGAPGAWATVRIRGAANAYGNTQPLYVVDGVPVYNTELTPERWPAPARPTTPNLTPPTPHTVVANPLLDLPVEEVEKIEVLQGAAATARYGMQGANGVILISTRRGGPAAGDPQPLRVRYAAWGGVQQVRQRYELLDARQYATLANAAALNQGRTPPYSPAALNTLQETDWQDRLFRVAGMQNHNLSVDGLAHHTRYYVAADYLQQTGVVKESSLSRYHLRANLDQQLNARLRVGLKASTSQTDQHYAGDFDAGQTLRGVLLAAPAGRPDMPSPNPLGGFNAAYHTPRTRRLTVQLDASYQLQPDLSLNVRGSREQAEARELGYSTSSPTGSTATDPTETSTGTASVQAWLADAALRYQHTFGKQHAVSAALNYQLQRFGRQWEQRTYTPYQQSTATFEDKSGLIHSPALAVEYTYAGRYEVQASLRSDFWLNPDFVATAANSWSPGAQLSWHLHKEAWLSTAAGLSELTLWAGTGRSGTFAGATQYISYMPSDRTVHHDAGLRLGVLGGRLTFEATAYQRRSTQLQIVFANFSIGGAPNPGMAPNTIASQSSLTVQNRGLLLALGSSWQLGALAGSTQLAAAANDNKVYDFNASGIFTIIGITANSQNLAAGQPLSQFVVYEQDGVYPAGTPRAGQLRYRDADNDGQPEVSYQGSGLPRYTLSLSQQLRLRRFQLAVQLDGLFGYQLLNTTLANLDSPNGYVNSSVRTLDYWTPTHQDTNVPQPGSYQDRLSDQNLASGDHLRLAQLTLSYELLNRGPRQASVWVGGQNLFVTGSYRGYDPNVSSGGAAPYQAGQDASVYPVARIWQLGVRASF